MIQRKQKIFVFVFMGVLMFVLSFAVYAYQLFFSSNILHGQEDRVLLIPTGANFKQVLDSLTKQPMPYVGNKTAFAFVSKVLGYQENVKPGRYILRKNSSNLSVVRLLRSGSQTPLLITFNNVRLKKDLAGKITRNLEIDSADFLRMLNDPAITSRYGLDTTTILCMFLPNSYEMYWTSSAEQVFEKMHKEYKKFWNQERLDKAKSIGLTPVQVTVLGSIVEAEIRKRDEAARIAGVYINRLAQNMPLQADPTVVYAVGDFSLKRVLTEHLKIQSPYNTYLNTGLPPGPINLPPVSTLDAVLNYEKHEYIFFVAKADFSGYHTFAKDWNEHVRNANLYREALNKQKIN